MEPQFFETALDFRNWLVNHHDKEKALLVGFYKVSSGKPSLTWPESVDQALCFGWIDGVRRSIDEESYTIRFTPRRPDSIWSAVNIKKVEELTAKGLMLPSGIFAFSLRKDEKSRIYSHENDAKKLSRAFEKQFKAHKKAWKFFSNQAPSYQKVMINWIMNAKQSKTQVSRLERAIRCSEEEKRMGW